mgnify:CR=1 FL=1
MKVASIKGAASILLLLFSISLRVYSQPLAVGILDFPPFYECQGEHLSGIHADLLKAVIKEAGYDHEMSCYPTKRLYKNIGSGKIDVFLGIKGPKEYSDSVLFSGFKIRDLTLELYALPEKSIPETKEHWPENEFIIINGYNYGGLIHYLKELESKKRITLHTALEHKNALEMLYRERGDYLLDYKNVIDIVKNELEMNYIQSREVFKLELYFIVSQEHPSAIEVMNNMELAYKRLYPDEQEK